ncbi:hypothetical protein APHAL10511_005942 [Amanita phalloides]|nr:hypothetical protein APHAL10511_005942 [Amanita phalloides]
MLDPPHRPLSPARLVSLANALGVPAPALRTPFRRTSPHRTSPRPTASPVPSSPAPPSSRFLLHVIPPLHLPHDDPRFTPPPPAAAGYHIHYRRGILVPVTPAFHALLTAIAKDYALPSTVGIVLYLVIDDHCPEPGPCLSEDTWTHIWTRVVRADLPQSRRGSPSEDTSTPHHPRPLLCAASKPQSVSSTSSTPDLQLNSTSPSLASLADPDTPDSLEGPGAFPLPGLNSTSLVPVLAKVEFDIDRKKARWYEPWLRSRRLNQAKRDDEQSDGKKPPLALLTGVKGATVPQVNGSDWDVVSNAMDDDATSKFFPPPLVLDPRLSVPYEASCIPGSSDSVHLAYLGEPSSPNKTGGSDEELDCYTPHRRPEESEKRVGTIFEALDLGLDMSVDFDEDRRRSQLLMKAKLDEIERAMMQLSPRALKDTVEDDVTYSPGRSGHLPPFPARVDSKDSQNASQVWPAVPYAALKESMNPAGADGPLSPPRLAVNGVTTSTPFVPSARSSLEQSSETQRRKQELEEEYPELVVKSEENVMSASPILLSPDPFSRYPTEMPPIPDIGAHLADGDQNDAGRAETVSSRFSIDSTDDVIAKPMNRTTLMSMKSIKKLWRKSDKSGSSGRTSLSERPSQEDLSLPPVPDISSPRISQIPESSASGRPSVEQLSTSSLAVPNGGPSPTFVHHSQLARLHFDQESPYPTRFSPPSARSSPNPTSPSLPAQAMPEPEKSRKSILKWRSKPRGESISQNGAGGARASVGRRPSMGSLIFGDAPMTSSEIPPSPRIPDHFQNHSRQVLPVASATMHDRTKHSSADSQTAFDHSMGSPVNILSPTRRSTGSSHETHPSFDMSQFEMVSPKTAAVIPLPWT